MWQLKVASACCSLLSSYFIPVEMYTVRYINFDVLLFTLQVCCPQKVKREPYMPDKEIVKEKDHLDVEHDRIRAASPLTGRRTPS